MIFMGINLTKKSPNAMPKWHCIGGLLGLQTIHIGQRMLIFVELCKFKSIYC